MTDNKEKNKSISDYLVTEEKAPHVNESKVYIPVTYFGDDRLGYDIQYFTKEEIINDVLKQYERFLSLIEEQSNVLYASAETLEQRS